MKSGSRELRMQAGGGETLSFRRSKAAALRVAFEINVAVSVGVQNVDGYTAGEAVSVVETKIVQLDGARLKTG